MNFFDYILIALVGLSMVLSLWRGFVREIISLIGLVAAFLVASRTSGATGDALGDWITNDTLADIAGFALIFVVIMIVVGITGAIIRKLVYMADLTTTDRTLGMFFGLARGLLLIALSFLIYSSYAKIDQPWLKESLLTPYAVKMGDLLGKAIPEGYPFSRQGNARKPSLPKLEDIKKAAKDAAKSAKEKLSDSDAIPVSDKEAMKSIIEQQLK